MPRAKSGKVVNCDECGKEFDKSPAEIKRSNHDFCSRLCWNNWHKRNPYVGPRASTLIAERVKVKCSYCGKNIIRKTSEIKNNKHYFCNIKCRAMWLPENSRGKNNANWKGSKKKLVCDWCGKEFERRKYSNCDHNFCSRDCWNNWFPKNIRGKRHHKWKAKVETECDWCGKKIKCFPSKMKDFKHHFCSNTCRIKWMVVRRGEVSFPTKPEKRVMMIVKKYNLPFRYVGDGSFKIDAFNPDFINDNGEKQVIEVFGRYWHDPSYYKEINRNIQGYSIAKNRKKIFRKSGYKTLILWDDEMKELSDEYIATKIQDFALSA